LGSTTSTTTTTTTTSTTTTTIINTATTTTINTIIIINMTIIIINNTTAITTTTTTATTTTTTTSSTIYYYYTIITINMTIIIINININSTTTTTTIMGICVRSLSIIGYPDTFSAVFLNSQRHESGQPHFRLRYFPAQIFQSLFFNLPAIGIKYYPLLKASLNKQSLNIQNSFGSINAHKIIFTFLLYVRYTPHFNRRCLMTLIKQRCTGLKVVHLFLPNGLD